MLKHGARPLIILIASISLWGCAGHKGRGDYGEMPPRPVIVRGADCPEPEPFIPLLINGEQSFDSPYNVNAFMVNADGYKHEIAGLRSANQCLRAQVLGKANE